MKARSPRAQLHAVAVEMTTTECDEYDGWQRRAIEVGGPFEAVIRFADWYPSIAQRWFAAATEAGVWQDGPQCGQRGRRDCRHPSESLAHAERADGVLIHHVVDVTTRPYAFRARWCRDASPFAFT